MDISQKKVLVFGSGISGIAAGRLLEKESAHVTIYDGNASLNKEDILKEIGDGSKAEIILGAFPVDIEKELDLLVLSPGVPTDLPEVARVKEAGVPVWGEVELAYVFGRGDVLAITGTNGKTTTTALLGDIMKACRPSVFVVGNIGNPYTEAVSHMTEDSVAVAEMSSFQLETVHTFRPKVSAILNISPDHLNRHHTMEAYIEAKKSIAKNQTAKDICVLNYEDEVTRKFGENIAAQVLYFSSRSKLETGIYLDDGMIVYVRDNVRTVICHISELKLLGTHNYENIMAAAGMALAYGVPLDIVRRVIKEFQGVEHRIEYIGEKCGVAYYNDSKGTNPDAAIKGIQAMNRRTVLIAGGYDKDSEYDEWIQAFDGKVKKLVLLGATREKIAEAAVRCGFDNIVFADTLADAVAKAKELAADGEAVLLSPACASWDMFKSYEERGDKFKEYVSLL